MTLPPLPREVRPFVGFCRLLRDNGFPIAPPQAVSFIAAIALLGPASTEDIRQAAHATLAPPPERRSEFDLLFRAFFFGESSTRTASEHDDAARFKDDGGRQQQPERMTDRESGARVAEAERLGVRSFEGTDEHDLAAFSHALGRSLPVRRSFRSIRARTHGEIDLRRSFREIVSADGDIPSPLLKRRKTVQIKILMLIDVSGSMKLHTADYMKVAYALVHGADRVEVLTLGTRLTRITPALRVHRRALALARVADQVDDWDGGTRLGTTLLTLLAIPRLAAFSNGAAIILLSDALERGDHSEFEQAMRRLAARSWRLSLATPLASDPRFRPETAALRAILPILDDLLDGSSVRSLTDFILALGQPASSAEAIWGKAA
jgi:uncharacterized protein with von Willebrand factor type A (vWA) domain